MLQLLFTALLIRPSLPLNLSKLFKPLRTIAPYFDEIQSREVSGSRSNRIYANATKLRQLSGQVTQDYLITPPSEAFRITSDNIWITVPFRATVLLTAYTAFPQLIESLRGILPDNTEGDVTAVTSGFAPAISLLYGAWLGLTFNILEQRIVELQRTAIKESAMICSLCERSALLAGEESTPSETSMKMFEVLFEQTTTLAVRSRQEELLQIVNDDIYWIYRSCLKQLLLETSLASRDSLDSDIRACNDMVDELVLIRAERLSKETKYLPSAHFIILAIFSLQLLACFVYVIAQSPTALDDPILRVAFSFFAAVYLLVFNFAIDLNDPFRGNYQIRRSAINANLISSRKRIAAVVGVEVASVWRDRADPPRIDR